MKVNPNTPQSKSTPVHATGQQVLSKRPRHSLSPHYREMKAAHALQISFSDVEKTALEEARHIFSPDKIEHYKNLPDRLYSLKSPAIRHVLEDSELERLQNFEKIFDQSAEDILSTIFPDKKVAVCDDNGIVIRNNHISDDVFHDYHRINGKGNFVTLTLVVPIVVEKGTSLTSRDNCVIEENNLRETIKYKLLDKSKVESADIDKMLFLTCANAQASLGEGFAGKPHAVPESYDDVRIIYLRRFIVSPNDGYDADID